MFLPASSTAISGLVLRRLYDSFHGRQRARVMVDGKFQAWWYDPRQDRASRWRWSQVGLDVPLVKNQVVSVVIDPPTGTALWTASRYEVLALIDSQP